VPSQPGQGPHPLRAGPPSALGPGPERPGEPTSTPPPGAGAPVVAKYTGVLAAADIEIFPAPQRWQATRLTDVRRLPGPRPVLGRAARGSCGCWRPTAHV